MDSNDWHFFTLERRGAAAAPLTDLVWAAARYGALVAFETLPMTPSERHFLSGLFAVVVDEDGRQRRDVILDTLGRLGTELRHVVDVAQIYGDDLHLNARAVARNAYQAALDVLPATERGQV